MPNKPITVQAVLKGSIAEEAGIEQGDGIIAINGEEIKDIFDYRFITTNENLVIEVEKKDGEVWEIEIEKDEYEDLGVEFECSMIDEAKSCTNRCIFCFIDQLPSNMRDTLYFKDDDSRLSFLMGNYITLTNIDNDQIDRIIKYRMSPINVSVHTTNSELRIFMLKNRYAGDIMDKIKRLVDGGITVNCQIVLCRGINDSRELDNSLEALSGLYPGVSSISVVPVGITKYRTGLEDLSPYDREASAEVIDQVEKWQRVLLKKFESRVVYLADEFYIMAGRDLPAYEEYEDFPQIENGVGLIAVLRNEFENYLKELPCKAAGDRKVSIATGVSAYLYIKEMTELLEKKFSGVKIGVYAIKNDFFGQNVTVTGLLTGKDIAAQLKNKELGEELFISRSMLKSGENLFLDDFTLEDLEKSLDIKVTVVDNDGRDFIRKLVLCD